MKIWSNWYCALVKHSLASRPLPDGQNSSSGCPSKPISLELSSPVIHNDTPLPQPTCTCVCTIFRTIPAIMSQEIKNSYVGRILTRFLTICLPIRMHLYLDMFLCFGVVLWSLDSIDSVLTKCSLFHTGSHYNCWSMNFLDLQIFIRPRSIGG